MNFKESQSTKLTDRYIIVSNLYYTPPQKNNHYNLLVQSLFEDSEYFDILGL